MESYEAEPKPSIIKPVMIGGIVGAVLGVIPMVSSCNLCCCLWFALGGVISVLLYKGMSSYGVSAGLGALLGLASGFISGIIVGTMQYFLQMQAWKAQPEIFDPTSEANQKFVEQMKEAGCVQEQINVYFDIISQVSPSTFLISSIILFFVGMGVSVLAGLITAAIAGKRQQYPEEPPPYEP